jgi:hypothetical protein
VKGGGDEQRDIRRNIERFPGDFMYQLTRQEVKDLRLQNATSNKEWGHKGWRIMPRQDNLTCSNYITPEIS